MEKILECKNLSYSYHSVEGETCALSNINFQINKGQFAAIVGASGCGKSTLLSLICGLLTPESGTIWSGSTKAPGYMLQKDSLLEWRTVLSNVLLGAQIQKCLTPERKEKALAYLKKYGLYDFRDKKPSELSGGMRQRAALIRTLLTEPDLLLLDEPFSALDYQTRLNVADDIGTIIRKEEKTAILVTHDLSEAISLSDIVFILSPHPGTICKTVPVVFPSDLSPLERRNSGLFHQYFKTIWEELNSYEQLIRSANRLSS